MRVGSLTLWFVSFVTVGVLVLAACNRDGPKTSTLPKGSPPKGRGSVENRERCATGSIPPDEARQIQAEIEKFQLGKENIKLKTTTRRIKVFFHVIRKGSAVSDGNIDPAKIYEQMNVLNQAYQRTNFQFDLAKPDFGTNPDFTTDPQWFEMYKGSTAEKEAKQALGVKQKDVLNVYTADTVGALGWALQPFEISSNPDLDGVVILFSTLPGGTSAPYDQGKTIVHEVGHWLGLSHTFEHGCTDPGDGVGDTPAEYVESRGCENRNTCPYEPGWDPINNFMDYSPDACTYMFTVGQSAVMDVMFATYRRGP